MVEKMMGDHTWPNHYKRMTIGGNNSYLLYVIYNLYCVRDILYLLELCSHSTLFSVLPLGVTALMQYGTTFAGFRCVFEGNERKYSMEAIEPAGVYIRIRSID